MPTRLVPGLIMKSIGGQRGAPARSGSVASITSSRKSREACRRRAEVLADAQHAAGPPHAVGDEAARDRRSLAVAGDPIELAAVVVEGRRRQAEAVGPADGRDRDADPHAQTGFCVEDDRLVEATNPAPRLMPRPRKLVSDTSAPPQNGVAALVAGNSSLMTSVPRSSTSTTSTTPPRLEPRVTDRRTSRK